MTKEQILKEAENSLKAKFLDNEPEIRSGAGVNRRDIRVIGQLPRLVADKGTPENMTQGE